MLGTPFTHDMVRKYVVAFGTLFNNIKLQRTGDSATDQWISVPLSYAAKEKWVARLTDPNLTNQVAISLPRMSYEMMTMTYAPERKMNTKNRTSGVVGDKDSVAAMYEPVPYDLSFSMFIYSRNARDATNILEQILPFFTPEFTVTINDATSVNVDVDCPIILNNISKEDSYAGGFEAARTIIWTLDFTMKVKLFGPIQSAKPIKKAYVDFFVPSSIWSFHAGNTAIDSSTTSELYLQANTAPRTSNTFDGATITITGETGSTSITGNTRTILSYDGAAQRIVVTDVFLDTPSADWSYQIQYKTAYSSGFVIDDGVGTPTASRIYTVPGLTSDGDPTSNASLTVAIGEIDANDDFGFIQTQTFFPSNTVLAGTRRNLSTGEDE